MFRGVRILVFVTAALAIGLATSVGAQVVDHTAIDEVPTYPQATMDAIGQQRWLFTHASVGGNIISGMDALHSSDPVRYQLVPVAVSYLSSEERVEDPPEPTVAGSVYECQRGNPGWSSKFQIFDNSVRTSGWHLPAVDAAMDKLCYIDQNADPSVYLQTMEALESAYPTTRFVYTTMPLTTSEDSNNILRNQYNETVRDYCRTHGKLLFDIADMEAHEPDGTPVTFTSGSETYQKLFADYSSDGGHLNSNGSIRIATGWYAVAERLVGGTGVPGDLDQDGDADAADLAVQIGCHGPYTCGDMDADGDTDGADTLALLDLLFG